MSAAAGPPLVAPRTWWVPPPLEEAWRALPSRRVRTGPPERPLVFSFPDPGVAEMERLAAALAEAGRSLARRPLAPVLEALTAAARSLRDPGNLRRQEALALLAATGGHAPAMLAESLDFLLGKLEPGPLRAALRAAAGEPRCLEGPALHPSGRLRHAVGPALTVHLLAGNTPWAGVESLAAALCARSASLVRVSSREPVLAGLFAQAVAAADAGLGEALAVVHWPAVQQALEEAALSEAEALVAFGDNATVAALAGRVSWRVAAGSLTLVAHGHRTAVAVVGAEARATADSARRTAAALARDFALEEQEGCLSPHGAYVENGPASGAAAGVSVDAFAEMLAEALEERERAWPRAATSAAEAAAVHQARGAAELRGARVLAPPGSTRWTVVVDPRPLFEPSPLARYAWLKPVPGVERALEALAPARGLLSTVGLAGFGGRAAEVAARVARAVAPGRVCAVGEMQRPPAGWSHDGASDLAALLRWVEVEDAAAGGAAEGRKA